MYAFLEEQLKLHFDVLQTYKDAGEKQICRIRHRETGKDFILRRFPGSAATYARLIPVACPNLAKVYEAATGLFSGSERALVLEEYVEGDRVSEMLKGATFSRAETKHVAMDVCRALYTLHSLGIVHRDVKPENIILRGKNAVLIDYDAARQKKEVQQSDTVILGTTGYAAPEQYGISQTDGRADIFALGVTMNIMLTGVHPSVRMATGQIGRIISRCTMVQPDKRYKDVRHLMEALSL